MPSNDMPVLPTDPEPPAAGPAVDLHLGPVHLRIDRVGRPPHWLMTLLAGVAGMCATNLHLLAR